MTKVMVDSWGWVYLHVVLDWASKKIVGWQLSPRSKALDWLEALSNAINKQFPEGIREQGALKLVCDNGCQPASISFMAASAGHLKLSRFSLLTTIPKAMQIPNESLEP